MHCHEIIFTDIYFSANTAAKITINVHDSEANVLRIAKPFNTKILKK